MADLWSDYTDSLLKDMDNQSKNKFSAPIYDVLSNLDKYTAQPNISTTLANMREYANTYIDGLLKNMPKEVKALDDSVAKADAITRQLAQNISMQSKQHDVPLIRPFSFTRDDAEDEIIELDTVDDQAIKLMEKLVTRSNVVADFSYQFKDKAVGSWLFGGEKNYLVNVHMPANNAMSLELARSEIGTLFQAALDYLRG